MESSEINEKIREGALRARIIIEIVGSPEEHVKKTIEGKLKEIEEKFEVIEKELAEPQKVSEKFHSSFIEAEVLFPDLSSLIGFIFDYMPSSIEIMEPEEITEDTQLLTEILNDLAVRLHQNSEAVIRLKAMNTLLNKKVEKKD
jgi:hypothetical protein